MPPNVQNPTFDASYRNMKIQEIISVLEKWAAPSLQESYDNSGLITGNNQQECTGTLICLDSTEAVVQEAIQKGCNLIIAHHPIVFSGLKRLTGATYIERTIILAIQNNIAIYAIHTNLDNINTGVSMEMANRLGLSNLQILQPKKGQLHKLITFVPEAYSAKVSQALFDAGAGYIGNYDECSFQTAGTGTFRANESANPFSGQIGIRNNEAEIRLEVIVPTWQQNAVLQALKSSHPYEEVAYDWISLENSLQSTGSGMMGEFQEPINTLELLKRIKEVFGGVVRYTTINKETIKRVALCGGSGSFLLKDAIRSGAELFLSADFKYHQFFDSEDKIIIADIGHFESEQFTMELIHRYLNQNISNFAGCLTTISTNPIHYL